MTQKSLTALSLIIAVLIGAALLYVRVISEGFVLGTDTFSHPYKRFAGFMIFAGLVWIGFIPIFKRLPQLAKPAFWSLITLGVVFRVLFMGSTPIYEDDWNRYLWDGAVTIEGHNPYKHPPEVTFVVAQEAPQDVKDLQALSGRNGGVTTRINNPHLTTIYPPVAMAVFAVSAKIKAFDLNVLRGLYIVIDGLSLWLLVKALSLYGRSSVWALLYWLNPMLIYSVYNAAHMDIILVPFLLLALILVKTRPLWAGVALGLAAAVKLWPLVLGPVLLRHYRSRYVIFVGAGALAGITAVVLILPMLLTLSDDSGLSVYSAEWERSNFLFGYITRSLKFVSDDFAGLARIAVALIVSGLSFWFAFKRNISENTLPAALMLVPLYFFLLSPTGYPWYIIWFLPFLPFLPLYGAALLTVTVALYYVRYAMGERDYYDLYTNIVIPIQFGIPILILMIEGLKLRRKAHG